MLKITNLTKTYGDKRAVDNLSLHIQPGEIYGFIGHNGAGKTTTIKACCGILDFDGGDIFVPRQTKFGYLEQHIGTDSDKNVCDELLTIFSRVQKLEEQILDVTGAIEAGIGKAEENAEKLHVLTEQFEALGGYTYKNLAKSALLGMGFQEEDLNKPFSALSGGEKTRVCLCKLLLSEANLLLLDEPTNHLDFETMEWLESYLKTYPGAILVVSHDRYFLDAVCNRIFEIEDNTLTAYKGNYSAYLPQKEAAVALQQKQHDADMEKAAKLEDYIARNLVRASTTKMAQSRRKQLEKMEITEAPRTSHTDLKFRFTFDVTPYNEILTAKNISVTLGGKRLVEGLDLLVKRGERLVIAGPNGAGKSTLLRVLDGKLRPQAGTVRLGAGAKPSVFEQQQLRRGGTVISTIWDKYPKFTELEVRSHLAKLNFRGEDVFKPCSALSGGELARLRFAEILLEKPNLLFLDEPTNHLDIYTRESLGAALASYEGTLVLVTHDRYLMNSLACPILFIENGKTSLYEDYDAMMHRGAVPPEKNIAPEKTASAGKAAYGKEQRRRRAELRTRIKALEDEMETLALRIMALEGEVNDPDVLRDHTRLRDVCDELDDTRFHQDEVLAEWERLVEEQEAYEQENDE